MLANFGKTMNMKETATPIDYDWLVKARFRVQEFMLDLHRHRSHRYPTAPKEERAILDLFVGVAFSLWRAAFLTDTDRNSQSIATAGDLLLAKLLEDNTVSYTHDRAMKHWMGGYYLNNARYRTRRIIAKMGLEPSAETPRTVAFSEMDKRGISERSDSILLWETIFSAQYELFQMLKKKAGTRD